jgi:hypothetical protein
MSDLNAPGMEEALAADAAKLAALMGDEEETAPPSKTYRLVHFHREDGVRVAVVGEPGRKWVYAATFDSPIRLLKLPLEEQKYMRDLTELTVQKAAKKMLAAGKRLGITDGARAFLKAVQ